jgi:hypothetical protein
MADYYRTGSAVTSRQDIIDEILNFVTDGAGAAWTEDATFTAGANPGELFLETSGATPMHIYFNSISIGVNDVLQAYWVAFPGGFGGGLGPTAEFSSPGACFFLDTTRYDYTLDLYADEERCIAVLHALVKEGVILTTTQSRQCQILYFGEYNPHCDTADDLYPLLIAGNCGTLIGLTLPEGRESGFFPESLAKKIGPGDLVFTGIVKRGWEPRFDFDFVPPRNSRGAEVFALQQDIHVRIGGSEEALSLTGMLITHPDVGWAQDVTIGVDTYRSFQAIVNSVPDPDVEGSIGPVYLVPKGTNIP